eukprot:jgi/Chlat1/2664/Chrsp179S02510
MASQGVSRTGAFAAFNQPQASRTSASVLYSDDEKQHLRRANQSYQDLQLASAGSSQELDHQAEQQLLDNRSGIPVVKQVLKVFGIIAGTGLLLGGMYSILVIPAVSVAKNSCRFTLPEVNAGHQTAWTNCLMLVSVDKAMAFWRIYLLNFWWRVYGGMFVLAEMLTILGWRHLTRYEQWTAWTVLVWGGLVYAIYPLIGSSYAGVHFLWSGYPQSLWCFWKFSKVTAREIAESRYARVYMSGIIVLGFLQAFYLAAIQYVLSPSASDTERTLFRLVLHPATWEAVLSFYREAARGIHEDVGPRKVVSMIMPLTIASIYGRFLIVQVENVGDIFLLNVTLALFETMGRLTTRDKDAWFVRILRGPRRMEINLAEERCREVRQYYTFLAMLVDYAGTVLAAIFYYWSRISAGGKVPSVSLVFGNMLVQLFTNAIADLANMSFDVKFHGLTFMEPLKKALKYPKTLALCLLEFLLGGAFVIWQVLNIFCPLEDEKGRILLQFCPQL